MNKEDIDRISRGRRVETWHIGLIILTVGWTVGMCAGWCVLASYANDPGPRDESPGKWPANSGLAPPVEKPVLVLFAHPHCPCTRATLHELERLLVRCGDRVDSHVVFAQPPQAPADWCATDLHRRANGIAGLDVVCDAHCVETNLFRARTSGLVLLYSSSGRLLFQGGITASRGHEGASEGAASLTAAILNRESYICKTHVFGCPLLTPVTLGEET